MSETLKNAKGQTLRDGQRARISNPAYKENRVGTLFIEEGCLHIRFKDGETLGVDENEVELVK